MLSANRQRGGVLSAELEVDIPAAALELWQTFLQLSRTRRSGMSAQPFTLVDIQAWCQLNQVALTTWELDTLLDMDSAAMSALNEIRRQDAASRSNA